MAREARLKRLEDAAPHVVVTLEWSTKYNMFFELIIENVGKGVAYNVVVKPLDNLSITPITSRLVDHNNASYHKIPILKPSQQIRTMVGKYNEIEPPIVRWRTECNATHSSKEVIANECITNIQIYKDVLRFSNDQDKEIAGSLKDIRDDLRKMVGSSRLQVDIHNHEDRERDNSDILQDYKSWNEKELGEKDGP